MTAMLVASLTAWTLPANGASLIWVGGNGTWDNTIANWTPGSVAWVNGTDTAVFNGGSGTVTLGVPITAGGLTFNNSDYTIAGGGNVLTLGLPAGTPSPVIAVNNTAGTFPARAVISAQLDGSSGFTKTGNGTLLLSNNSNGISGDISTNQLIFSKTIFNFFRRFFCPDTGMLTIAIAAHLFGLGGHQEKPNK